MTRGQGDEGQRDRLRSARDRHDGLPCGGIGLQVHCALKGHNTRQSGGNFFCEWNERVSGNFEEEGVDKKLGGTRVRTGDKADRSEFLAVRKQAGLRRDQADRIGPGLDFLPIGAGLNFLTSVPELLRT